MVPENPVLAQDLLILNVPDGRVGATHTAFWDACLFCGLSESGVEGIECQLPRDKRGKRAKQRDEKERPHDECRGLWIKVRWLLENRS